MGLSRNWLRALARQRELYFADGVVHGATFATQDIRGFDDLQIATLKSIAAPLARAVENRSLRRTASALLDAHR
jgi:hypothetical protein